MELLVRERDGNWSKLSYSRTARGAAITQAVLLTRAHWTVAVLVDSETGGVHGAWRHGISVSVADPLPPSPH